MYRLITTLLLCCFLLPLQGQAQTSEPLKIGVIGLSHGHVGWILGREDRGDVEVVGIVEPNRELATRYAKDFGYSIDIVYDSMEEMLAAKKPEAVTAFGSIYQHLEIVEACAPKGIHVMVEKPLAVSMKHAEKMVALAKKHNIHLLTNYETTWYPTNQKAFELLKQGTVGDVRKIIVRDGHKGPVALGIHKEFLDWLLDPVLNGGGAITDFGCYGANLVTWLQAGERPTSVTAVTQQFQPENHPNVDDEATIIVTYEKSQAIIQASWNWPMGRKDMEIYGLTGAIYSDNRTDLRVRMAEGYDGFAEETYNLETRTPPFDDPFALLAGVVKGEIKLEAFDPTTLENNFLVVEILEAAKKSAASGKTIKLTK